jgi:hypothetical protein
MARKKKEDWSEEENSEDIHDSEDEVCMVLYILDIGHCGSQRDSLRRRFKLLCKTPR